MTRVDYLLALGVIHVLGREFHRRTVRREQLKLIAEGEFIALAEHRFPVIIAAFDHGGNVRAGGVAGLGVVLAGVAVIKAGGIRAVAHLLRLFYP